MIARASESVLVFRSALLSIRNCIIALCPPFLLLWTLMDQLRELACPLTGSAVVRDRAKVLFSGSHGGSPMDDERQRKLIIAPRGLV